MIALDIIGIVFTICLMFLIAPFMQVRLYEVNPELFHKVKINKLAFMFRGIGGKNSIYGDVREYGIAIPLFVLQVLGYTIAATTIILVLLLLFIFKLDLRTIVIISYIILGGYAVILVASTSITMIVSRNREKKVNKK